MYTTNGGSPLGIVPIPADDCPGGAGDLSGVWGINNPDEYWDMTSALEANEAFLPNLIPFGYDAGNGPLFIDMISKPGSVVYCPWDEFAGESYFPTYHVANSITEFLERAAILAENLPNDA